MRRWGAAMTAMCVTTVALAAQTGYVPNRVVHTGTGQLVDFEGMLNSLATADVVFVGEQHDDPNTHRLELAVLEGLERRRGDVILSLEMFERDVQSRLDRFLADDLDEETFLADARPWPRYTTDYKPLVDFARSKAWPVLAANVPRPVASEVSKAGLGVLDGKPVEERAWIASELQCPLDDAYFARFTEAMGGHPAEGEGEDAVAAQREMTERFYLAQCVKDETMGESIAAAWTRASEAGTSSPLVVHFNGAFHSDFHLGTADRVRRRLPAARVIVVTMMPVEQIATVTPGEEDLRRADFLVYTIR